MFGPMVRALTGVRVALHNGMFSGFFSEPHRLHVLMPHVGPCRGLIQLQSSTGIHPTALF